VHLTALKRFIGVGPKAPRHLVYGETGRYPLYVNTYSRCIKFWLRLTMLEDHRYPKKAYNMLLALQRQNCNTWACKIRNVLYRFGFGLVWEAQGVGITKVFITKFKQRLIDCFTQDWNASLEEHDFYYTYASFNRELKTCDYLCQIKNIFVRNAFARFRIGMSPLRSHFLQYKSVNRQGGVIHCPFCSDCVETELHFLLICPKYALLRNELIWGKFTRQPNMFKFSVLMAATNSVTIRKLSLFVCKALVLSLRVSVVPTQFDLMLGSYAC
jgi:hypothetical protein